jgi:putative transposase
VEPIFYKTYKFRLLPTKEQEVLIAKHFGCSRFIYNYFLKEKQEHYLKNKKTLNFNNCADILVKIKEQKEYCWLNDVNAQSLQSSLKHLESAYGQFFKKVSKFPKFKSKRDKNSFTIPQFVKLKNKNHIQLVKFKEGIKFINHREIKGKIKKATIFRNPTGKYYISILTEHSKFQLLSKTNQSIGLDLGIKDFIVTSEGQRFQNPKYTKQYEKKLRIKQKALSRKQKGSKQWESARVKLAKVYEKITNSRENMQHQISSQLIRKYDLIGIEKLNIGGMIKNRKLSKSISDIGWSSFITKLKYKANWYGKEVQVIERFYPSSKTCNHCLHIKESLSLDERSWTCVKCNTLHDRDINAAKNILMRAQTIKSSGLDDYGYGAGISPKASQDVSGTSDEVSKKRKYKLISSPK